MAWKTAKEGQAFLGAVDWSRPGIGSVEPGKLRVKFAVASLEVEVLGPVAVMGWADLAAKGECCAWFSE